MKINKDMQAWLKNSAMTPYSAEDLAAEIEHVKWSLRGGDAVSVAFVHKNLDRIRMLLTAGHITAADVEGAFTPAKGSKKGGAL